MRAPRYDRIPGEEFVVRCRTGPFQNVRFAPKEIFADRM